MKIKIWPDDASMLQMNDWLADLRDDGRAEPPGDGGESRTATVPGQKPPPSAPPPSAPPFPSARPPRSARPAHGPPGARCPSGAHGPP